MASLKLIIVLNISFINDLFRFILKGIQLLISKFIHKNII